MLGIWKNVEDLEINLTLSELELILSAAREKEDRNNRFLAAINGIDIDGDKEEKTVKEKVEEKKQILAAQAAGKTREQFELDAFGIDIEIEE